MSRTTWLRAVVVASFAAFLGTAGHVSADGRLPGPIVLAILVVTLVVASVPPLVASSRLRIVLLLVAGQTWVHVILTLTAGHAAPAAPRGSHQHAGAETVVGHAHATDTVTAAASPWLHLVADLDEHAPMMVVHLVAAALVGLWLAHGENSLRALGELTARSVLTPLLALWWAPPVPAPIRRVTPVECRPAPRLLLLLARSLSRRGPPLLLA